MVWGFGGAAGCVRGLIMEVCTCGGQAAEVRGSGPGVVRLFLAGGTANSQASMHCALRGKRPPGRDGRAGQLAKRGDARSCRKKAPSKTPSRSLPASDIFTSLNTDTAVCSLQLLHPVAVSCRLLSAWGARGEAEPWQE